MMTTVLIVACAVVAIGLILTRRWIAAICMIAGAAIGSSFGVAGFGGAISGAIPGAVVGLLAAKAFAPAR